MNNHTNNNMKSGIISVASLLAVTVRAQTAPQFEVVAGDNLPVTYEASDTEVSPPGVLLPRNGKLIPSSYHILDLR